MDKLRIAKNLSLPVDAVTNKIAILGMSGSGKSYCMTKIAEEMLDAKAQVIILDPKGEAWGLRLLADGKRKGYPVPVFGGEHGDVPLRPDMGKRIADLLIQGDYSAIIDVSEFISSEIARFGYDFATQFLHLKKQKPGAVCIMIDEAQDFIPQNPQPAAKGRENYEPRMLHAFERLQKQGRSKGIGLLIAGQRPQEINKKVLNLSQLWITFQLAGLQERTTTVKYIGEKDIEAAKEIERTLPRLEIGNAYFWSPVWLKISGVYSVLKKTTFDSSATPEVGARTVEARKLSPVDVERIETVMADVVKQAETNDPNKLHARIRQLEAELAKKPAPSVEIREVPAFSEKDIARIEKLAESLTEIGRKWIDKLLHGVAPALTDIEAAIEKLQASIPKHQGAFNLAPGIPGVGKPGNQHSRSPISISSTGYNPDDKKFHEPKTGRVSTPTLDGSLPEGERKVLTAIAQYTYRGGATREQITILTGYKRSTRDAYIQRLSGKGFVRIESGNVLATVEGIAALGDFEPLPTGRALIDYWLERLPDGERRVFQVLVSHYPKYVPRDGISNATDYKRSTRDAYIQRLGVRKLCVTNADGVKASDDLFS